MSQTLSLQLPDDLYAELATEAQKLGQSPDQLILAYLRDSLKHTPLREAASSPPARRIIAGYDPANDPLARFIGAFPTKEGDLAERHDEYLAEAYGDSHEDEDE